MRHEQAVRPSRQPPTLLERRRRQPRGGGPWLALVETISNGMSNVMCSSVLLAPTSDSWASSRPTHRSIGCTVAFRAATARDAEEDELALLTSRFEATRAHFAANSEDAEALLSVGASSRDESIDTLDLAAHAVVCSVILNLDEVLTRP